MCSSISKKSMEEVWGRSTNQMKHELAPIILQILSKYVSPEALLLAQIHTLSKWYAISFIYAYVQEELASTQKKY